MARPTSTVAERQRRRRARVRDGLVVLAVEVDTFPLAEAMIDTGRLSEDAALDRRRLAAAVGALVREWVAGVTRDCRPGHPSGRIRGDMEIPDV